MTHRTPEGPAMTRRFATVLRLVCGPYFAAFSGGGIFRSPRVRGCHDSGQQDLDHRHGRRHGDGRGHQCGVALPGGASAAIDDKTIRGRCHRLLGPDRATAIVPTAIVSAATPSSIDSSAASPATATAPAAATRTANSHATISGATAAGEVATSAAGRSCSGGAHRVRETPHRTAAQGADEAAVTSDQDEFSRTVAASAPYTPAAQQQRLRSEPAFCSL